MFDKDLDQQPATKSPASSPKKRAPHPKRKPASQNKDATATGAPGDEPIDHVMQNALTGIEAEVATFKATPSDKRRVILAAVAGRITRQLDLASSQIEKILELSNPEQASGERTHLSLRRPDYEDRLTHAIKDIEEPAKNGHLQMAEYGLARMFDREDKLRGLLGFDLANRADHYYDEAKAGGQTKSTPTARDVADDIKSGGEDENAKPTTRDGYLNGIKALHTRLRGELNKGHDAAARLISEPPAANPSLLEAALDAVLAFVTSATFGALGAAIGAGALYGLANSGVAAAAKSLKDALGANFKAKKSNSKVDSADRSKRNAPGGMDMLNAKSRFLHDIASSTVDAITEVEIRLERQTSMLRRLPTDTLAELHGLVDKSLVGFSTRYTDLLIREWVNFVKAMSDEKARHSASDAVGKLVEPQGVLRIDLGVRGQIVSWSDMHRNKISGLEVRDVTLPGTTPIIRENLSKQEQYTLQSIPLHKKVVVSLNDQLPAIEFNVTREYQIEPPKWLNKIQMDLLAEVAGFGLAGGTRDIHPGSEALPMLNMVFTYLSQIPASRIR
jgi:hypothetical protein